MNFYSQAGQDRFVWELLVKSGIRPLGTFLDIGSGGKQWSNTLGLEEIGWTGWLVDNSDQARDEAEMRDAKFFWKDARTMDYWESGIPMPATLDYLSVDVDEDSYLALVKIPLKDLRFRVITCEHDKYRYGDALRFPQRELLQRHMYVLVNPDVCNPVPFEDWYVAPELAEIARKILHPKGVTDWPKIPLAEPDK